MRHRDRILPLAALALPLAAAAAAPARAVTTERVSVSGAEVQADDESLWPAISGDVRYVAFVSSATNLVPGDTNGASDVFVRDRVAGTTERVSVGPGGAQADGYSTNPPTISRDGRYVAFYSPATNLVPGDTNDSGDVFVRDRQAGTTVRVSVGPGGVQGDGDSYDPIISGDGRYVMFYSAATNLVAGDTNGHLDILVHDLRTGATERVSVGSGGAQADSSSYPGGLSADGRYATFSSAASNLVPGDTNGAWDVFVRDRVAGTTERVNVRTGGAQARKGSYSYNGAVSDDGRYVAFNSNASNLVKGDTNGASDVFVRDRLRGSTSRVSVGPGGAQADGYSDGGVLSLSASGRYVAFESSATNLVPGGATGGDTNVFVHDRRAKVTRQVNLTFDGRQPGGVAQAPAISVNGRYVAYFSYAPGLVPGDTNETWDIFVARP